MSKRDRFNEIICLNKDFIEPVDYKSQITIGKHEIQIKK